MKIRTTGHVSPLKTHHSPITYSPLTNLQAASHERRVTHLRFRLFRGGDVLGRGAGFGRAWLQSERSCPGIAHLRFGRTRVMNF